MDGAPTPSLPPLPLREIGLLILLPDDSSRLPLDLPSQQGVLIVEPCRSTDALSSYNSLREIGHRTSWTNEDGSPKKRKWKLREDLDLEISTS